MYFYTILFLALHKESLESKNGASILLSTFKPSPSSLTASKSQAG